MRKVLVFDIGNVLFFTRWENAGLFLETKYSIPAQRVVDLFWGSGWHGRSLELFLDLNEGTDEQFYQIAQKKLGISIPEAIFWEMWNQQWEMNEGVILLVERIYRLPNPPVLAICSNINQPHWTHLCVEYKVMDCFTHAALSYRVGAMKPDQAMFKFVERATSCKEGILFVDDRKDNTEAAEKFGWQIHLYQEGQDNLLKECLESFLGIPL